MISDGMIFLDIFLGIFGLIMALGFIAANDSHRKKYKSMNARTTGKIVSQESEYRLNTNWKRDDTPSQKILEDRYADYVFNINGTEYSGSGEISHFNSSKSVKIRYNPDDPGENCTAYDRLWKTGTGEALFCLIFIGCIICIPVLFGLLFG